MQNALKGVNTLSDDINEVEQRLMTGIHGAPELRRDEKLQYLGEFRERVLKVLSKEQMKNLQPYPEIETALKDPRSSRLLLNGDLDYDFRAKYLKLAHKYAKPYTIINDPELKGDTGLAVISEHAVDADNVEVE
jgi:uncharacterized protein YueI